MECGIRCQPVSWYNDAAICEATEETLENTSLYRNGEIYLQSLSSMLPPLYLAPQAGENILDMTAAPGGKTCEMYALSGGKALITACERDKIRFERLKFNLSRQGATRVSALCQDATTLNDFLRFDKILLDAPCTGSGTATPHAPLHIIEQYLQKCVAMQTRLLTKALTILKTGGRLVYSTCSILEEENSRVIESALRAHRATLLPIQPPDGVETLPSISGTVTIRPNEIFEGFFVAVLTK